VERDLIAFVHLIRFPRPGGTILLYIPCLWGLILASAGYPSVYDLCLFFIGAFLMRSVGCAYNDWVDTDVDRQISRTKSRPLAAKQVSGKAVLLLSTLLLGLAFLILLQLSKTAVYVGFIAALAIIPYPWLKRVTHWPQVYLGCIFSSGVLMAWVHVRPVLLDWTLSPLLLYGTAVLWTTYYDTIYGYQDLVDDKRTGVKSIPVLLGPSPHLFLVGCLLAMFALLIWLGQSAGFSILYYVTMSVVVAHATWQLFSLDVRNPTSCGKIFLSNQVFGFLVALAIALGFWGN